MEVRRATKFIAILGKTYLDPTGTTRPVETLRSPANGYQANYFNENVVSLWPFIVRNSLLGRRCIRHCYATVFGGSQFCSGTRSHILPLRAKTELLPSGSPKTGNFRTRRRACLNWRTFPTSSSTAMPTFRKAMTKTHPTSDM